MSYVQLFLHSVVYINLADMVENDLKKSNGFHFLLSLLEIFLIDSRKMLVKNQFENNTICQ